MGRLLDRLRENHREFMAMGHVRFAFLTVLGITVFLTAVVLVLRLTQ